MLVLFTAFLLLVCAPAGLLLAGRAIGRATDFEARRGRPAVAPAPVLSEDAWYTRPMQPVFRRNDKPAEAPVADRIDEPQA